jgi:hypothetical protein
MSGGLIFVGGFVTGGFTVFIVTAVSVWRPVIEEWKTRFYEERKRRIAAESNPSAFFGTPIIRSPHVEDGQIIQTKRALFANDDTIAKIIDLTGVDDPMLDDDDPKEVWT